MSCAVSFFELGLAIDAFVMLSEEAIYQFALIGCDTLEAMFLQFAELCYHFLVNLEIAGTVLPWIAERFSSHASEGEQARHAERWVDQDSLVPSKLFGIHGPHASCHDEGRLNLFDLLAKERHCFSRHHGYIWRYNLYSVFVESVAQAGGSACGSAAGEAVEI